MRRVLPLLAVALVACGEPEPHALLVDSDFAPWQLESIDAAADAWAVAADDAGAVVYLHAQPLSRLTLSDWEDGPRALYLVSSGGIFYEHMSRRWGHFYGLHVQGSIAIAADRIPTEAAFGRVVRHEFGHILGLTHDAKIGLMASNEIDCIDAATLATYCDENPCGADSAPECDQQ